MGNMRSMRWAAALVALASATAWQTSKAVAVETLYENENGFKLLGSFQGGLGAFGVSNTDFGAGNINSSAPLSGTVPPSQRRTDRGWVEGFIKPSAEARLPAWDYGTLYGLGSLVATFTRGDGDATSSLAPQGGRSTTSDQPEHFTIEDAVIGWRSGALYPSLGNDAFDISGGDQSFVLNDAFLVGTGTVNGFHRAALYLAPRTAFDRTMIVKFDSEPVRASLFKLETHTDQDEMHGFDQPKSKFVGGDLELFSSGVKSASAKSSGEKQATEAAQATEAMTEVTEEKADLWTAGITYLKIYDADSTPGVNSFPASGEFEPLGPNANRNGLNVYSGYVAGAFFPFNRDILFYSQFAIEKNSETNREVNANAWYVEPGYRFSALPWTPEAHLRYAHFSGDGSPTDRVKKSYDPLFFTSGSRGFGSWTIGEIYGQYLGTNSNIDVAMASLKLSPLDTLDVGAIYYRFDFDKVTQFNNPAITSNHALDEADIYATWSPRKWLAITGVTGFAVPGRGFRQAASSFVATNGPVGRSTGGTMALGELFATVQF